MMFHDADIDGVIVIELQRHEDERGYFVRTYCEEEFERRGLNTRWVQCNLSHSARKGTLRGIHYQAWPESEIKLIRVVRGGMFGVAVDLRPGSSSFGRHFSRTFDAAEGAMIYVPAGCGFGFETLSDQTELYYQMSEFYRPALAGGVRWDDPALAIPWPLQPTCLSARDASLPFLHELRVLHETEARAS